jgi:hypothetical protein
VADYWLLIQSRDASNKVLLDWNLPTSNQIDIKCLGGEILDIKHVMCDDRYMRTLIFDHDRPIGEITPQKLPSKSQI